MGLLDALADQLEASGNQREETAQIRRAALERYPTPLHMAEALTPKMYRTPALTLLSEAIAKAITTPGSRLLISMPPQQGKTSLLRHAAVWALIHDPDNRIAYVSYAKELAAKSGEWVRDFISEFGSRSRDPITGARLTDYLGIALRRGSESQSDWALENYLGSMRSVGIRGGLTGSPVSVALVDDPLKDQEDADSKTKIPRLHAWFDSVMQTRLGGKNNCLIITQTRWVENDLIGRLKDHPDYTYINIPALSDSITPDALNRPAGVYLESARGTSIEQWRNVARDVGERTWNALYQGRPAPLEGGVFKTKWFQRIGVSPELDRTIVTIDPADNPGTGDETGIIVMGRDRMNKFYVLEDQTSSYTVAQWVRAAVILYVRYKADKVIYEQSLSNLKERFHEAYIAMRAEAKVLIECDYDMDAAIDRIILAGEDRETVQSRLTPLLSCAEDIYALSSSGIPVESVRSVGSKTHRMLATSVLYETSRVFHVGNFNTLEFQMTTWQEGQSSPNNVDTLCQGLRWLDGSSKAGSLTRSGGMSDTSNVRKYQPNRSSLTANVISRRPGSVPFR